MSAGRHGTASDHPSTRRTTSHSTLKDMWSQVTGTANDASKSHALLAEKFQFDSDHIALKPTSSGDKAPTPVADGALIDFAAHKTVCASRLSRNILDRILSTHPG